MNRLMPHYNMSLSDKEEIMTSFTGQRKVLRIEDVREAVKELIHNLDEILSDTEIQIIKNIFGEKLV